MKDREKQIAELKKDMFAKYPNADLRCNIIANEADDVADWIEELFGIVDSLQEELKAQHKDQEKLYETARAIGFTEHARLHEEEISKLKEELKLSKWNNEDTGEYLRQTLEENQKLKEENERLKQGWKPIETAPKDGTNVLVYFEAATVPVVHIAWFNCKEEWERADKFTESFESFEEYEGWWSYTRHSVTQEKLDGYRMPTHWMALTYPEQLTKEEVQ